MDKYLIFAFRILVRVFPKPIRNIVKKNSQLTSWYRKGLAMRGYIPKTAWDPAILYASNKKQQDKAIEDIAGKHIQKLNLLVIVWLRDKRALEATVDGIASLNQPPASVTFLSEIEFLPRCRAMLDELIDDAFEYETSSNINGSVKRNEETPTFIIFSGDVPHPDALKVLSCMADSQSNIGYVDTDRLYKKGRRVSPEFYPDWNPDLQITTGYVRSGVWLRYHRDLLELVKMPFGPSMVCEWLITCYLQNKLDSVQHIPLVLLHRQYQLAYVYKKPSISLMTHLRAHADIRFSFPEQVFSLKWHVKNQPLVSLIIPTKNAKSLVKDCIESILSLTNYQNYEILLVDNNSDDEEALAYFSELDANEKIQVLKYPKPFNYSAINNFAVDYAKGEVIGLINNDIEVIEPDWLTHMVGHVMRSDIGCVGAKLLYSNRSIQHAGVVMGYGGGAGHAHKHFPENHQGYLNRLLATHNYSAVTAACLLVTKSDFDAVGGLNETDLTVAFNDVDFCLRVLGLGRRNLYCAEAVLFHHESVSRGADDSKEKAARFEKEVTYLKNTWKSFIEHDPAYNPNLTLRYENFTIKHPDD